MLSIEHAPFSRNITLYYLTIVDLRSYKGFALSRCFEFHILFIHEPKEFLDSESYLKFKGGNLP